LDVAKTTKTIDKGLLKVFIPIKEEEKPIEIEVK
jgi:ABC-type tungstate transport system permease subunit